MISDAGRIHLVTEGGDFVDVPDFSRFERRAPSIVQTLRVWQKHVSAENPIDFFAFAVVHSPCNK